MQAVLLAALLMSIEPSAPKTVDMIDYTVHSVGSNNGRTVVDITIMVRSSEPVGVTPPALIKRNANLRVYKVKNNGAYPETFKPNVPTRVRLTYEGVTNPDKLRLFGHGFFNVAPFRDVDLP